MYRKDISTPLGAGNIMTLYLYQSFFLWSRNVIPRKNNYVKMPYCQLIQIVPYSWNVHICVKAQRSPLSTNFEPCIYIYRLHRTKLQTKVYIILYLRYSVYSVCTWNKTLLFDVHTLNPYLECLNTYTHTVNENTIIGPPNAK